MVGTRKTLDAFPKIWLDSGPAHSKSMKLGHLAQHLAGTGWLKEWLHTGFSLDIAPGGKHPEDPQLRDAAGNSAEFDKNVAAGRATQAWKDEEFFKPWALLRQWPANLQHAEDRWFAVL